MRVLKLLPLVLLLVIFARPAQAQKTYRIMPLGDSITQADINHNSYRRPLWRMLQAANMEVDFVGSLTEHFLPRMNLPPDPDFDLNHEGHAGLRADEILARLPAWAAAAQPDIVLLHVGTNDVMQGQGNRQTRNEISQIIDVLRSVNPSVVVLVAQLIPHDIPLMFNTPSVDGLNALIPQMVQDKTTALSPVILVDMHSGFNVQKDLDPDRIHPSVSGEALMAAHWFDALKRIISTRSGAYELLTNGSFEVKHSGWNLIQASDDRTACKLAAWEGECTFRFRGSPGERSRLRQIINAPPLTVGSSLILSAATRTTGTPNARARVIIVYNDGTRRRIDLSVPPSADYSVLVSETVVIAKPVRRIKVVVLHRSQAATVILDSLRLLAVR
jgi:lysophospholipase L1-like esterase